MEDDDWFFGYGSIGACFDLRDAPDGRTPRLEGMRSVSPAAIRALHREPAQPKRQRIGFRTPRSRS